MRETRLSGSEGGARQTNASFPPLSFGKPKDLPSIGRCTQMFVNLAFLIVPDS